MRGSIIFRENKDGSVTFYIKFRDADGRQVKRAVGPSRREAEGQLADAISAVNKGELRATPTRQRFEDYALRWLEEHRAQLEPGTYRDYRTHLRKRLIPYFGKKKLRSIDTPMVRRYVTEQAKSKLSAKTINNSITVLRVALGHAVEDKLISVNPAASAGHRERIKLPNEHREMDFLRLDEIPAYLAACGQSFRLIAEVLLATGMRISEVLALRWGDVDWRGKALYVRRSLKDEGVGSTKSDRSRRVEVGPRLMKLLGERYAVLSEHGGGDELDALVFPSRGRGYRSAANANPLRPYSRSHIGKEHARALKAAGLRHLRLHDLRHSAAASWLAAGLPMIYVQRQLGHKQISTTIDLYGHLEESFLRDAARKAEEAVWEKRREPVEA